MSNKRDLLSLLLQRARSQEQAAHENANEAPRKAVDTNAGEPEVRIAPPARVEPSDGVRPISPRQTARSRPSPQNAPARDANNPGAHGANVLNSLNVKAPPPRVHIESTREEPITLSQIANSPTHAAPGKQRASMTPEILSRIIIYPILFVALIAAIVFAWNRFSGNATDSKGELSNGDSKELNLNNTDPNQLQNAAGAQNRSSPEDLASNPPADPSNENAAAPGNTTNNVHVIRAIAYTDSPDGLERANTTVSELRKRGFSDARTVRLPKDKEATRFEIVVLLGRAESARDSTLVQLRERLQTLPGFLSSQSKQRPFQGSLIMRQPDADRAPSSR